MAQANLNIRNDFGSMKNQVEIDAISYNWEGVWKNQYIRKRAHHPGPAWPVAEWGPGEISYPAQLLEPQLRNGILEPNLSRRPEITDPSYKVHALGSQQLVDLILGCQERGCQPC